MGEIQELNFEKTVEEDEERVIPQHKNKKRWVSTVVYTLFVLVGQSSATLLGRLYYTEGGNSVLVAALLETVGFPILIPFALYFSSRNRLSKNNPPISNQPSDLLIKSFVYAILGLFQAATAVLYSIGLQNLPVSTFSLINSTQLGFNAVFAFFFNAQKFTPLILNALVLVTVSSALLIFQDDTTGANPNGKSKTGRFVVGFSCTLVASALYSLMLSMTQLFFQKVLKRETFSTVLKMIVYQSMVATFVVTVPLFTRGEWSSLRNEMEIFETGKITYVAVLAMIGLAWQVYAIGTVGLVFEVSSLFSNVIGAVCLPIVPIMAAVFFHEKMNGIKAISIVLAVWGFVSYVYQHYLDSCEKTSGGGGGGEVETVQELSQVNRRRVRESENFIKQEYRI
ncbi:hypothetical protein ABFS83_08G130400 [Erythranthe nasuta]